MGKQHDTKDNTNHVERSDSDTSKKHQTFIEGLGNALSNDENGFSNEEGFNKDGEHQNLADSSKKSE